MAEAVLGLGSNLGARRAIFRAALALLDATPGLRVLARSSLYETPPLGPPQPTFLNAAVRVAWDGAIEALFAITSRVEQALGRERRVRWGPRTLDIDILHWSEGRVELPQLHVPHRGLGERPFALAPLLDVAPELAPLWGPVLAALGGPPPLAQPGWIALQRAEGGALSDWLRDEGELASLALEAALPARHGGGPLAPRAFEAPLTMGENALETWVERTAGELAADGFALHAAAVLARDATALRGVLVGERRATEAPLAACPVAIERDPETGAGRVRVRGAKP